jgi:hypothetical protein
MKYLILLVICLGVSGCANFRTEYLGNRITCTVAKDKAYVTSLWGIIGISSEIVSKDSKVICSKQNDEE